MDEATTYIDSLLAEEKSPELEFGAVYTVRIVEIEERGVKVEIHPTIPLVFVSNAQLDAKKVMHPRLAHLIKLLLFTSPENLERENLGLNNSQGLKKVKNQGLNNSPGREKEKT